MRCALAALAGLALGLSGAAGHATTLLADREEPGANRPPTGRSLLDELFAIPPATASGVAALAVPVSGRDPARGHPGRGPATQIDRVRRHRASLRDARIPCFRLEERGAAL